MYTNKVEKIRKDKEAQLNQAVKELLLQELFFLFFKLQLLYNFSLSFNLPFYFHLILMCYILYKLQEMPRRREKRTDTENSDSFQDQKRRERVVPLGTVRFNRMLAPDQIDGDDTSRFDVLAWSNTLQAQRLLPWPQRKALFGRALACLPGSYKIWHSYLSQFVEHCSSRSLQSKEWPALNAAFQQALVKLPRMPRLWLMYAQALEKQHMVRRAREVYNWSFRNLPLTQHQKIWQKFSAWVMRLQRPDTALHVIPRYIKLNPDFKESYAEYLISRQLYNQAAKVILAILDDQGYHSRAGKDRKAFYFELCDLVTHHPEEVTCVDGPQFIKKALTEFPEEAGRIWVQLGDYYARKGQFELARKQLEEAIESVDSAKDFGIIFSAYVKFEEQMITALGSDEIRNEYQVVSEDNVDYEIEARLQRLQSLLDRQPQLLINISIRKNPNDVQSWLALISLHRKAGNRQLAIETLQRALQAIKPESSQGRLSEIWVEYSRMLQEVGELRRCHEVLHAASQVVFRTTEDSLAIWRRWAEMLIEERYYEDALKVVKHVLFRRKQEGDAHARKIDEAMRIHPALWQLYIDLEINLGNFSQVKTAFDRCKQHRSLTPLMMLKYAQFLWDNLYFQETFRVFEFAVSNFKWPALYEIWLAYTSKFVARHSATPAGVERARSMFQRLLREVPTEHCMIFYFSYAEFEENYGLYSHAVEIYDRMVRAVPQEQRFRAYSIYIAKVAKLLGVTKTRPIFESALQALKEAEILVLGRKYAELETNLGEIERARAVLGHISQFTDPRDDSDGLWADWQKFEVQYGDKDSYKEYMRIKRSVEAKYVMLPPDFDKIEDKIRKGLI